MPTLKLTPEEKKLWLRGDNRWLQLFNARLAQGATDNSIYVHPTESNLEEVVIRPQAPTIAESIFRAVKKDWNSRDIHGKIDLLTSTLGPIPGVGDTADFVDAGNQFAQGNWGWGAVSLASGLIPFVPASTLRTGVKSLLKGISKLGSKRAKGLLVGMELADDVVSNPSTKALQELHSTYRKNYPDLLERSLQTKSAIFFKPGLLLDFKDAKALLLFARKYGYKLPKGIERYSGEMLDKEFLRVLKQHNTFGRGVWADNILDAEKFLTTAHSGTTGRLDNMPTGKTGLYTMNGISPYGNYQGVLQRHLDFTGPRSTWIDKNDTKYLNSYEAGEPLRKKLSEYYETHPYDFLFDDPDYYDKAHEYMQQNYPELYNSSGLIYVDRDVDRIRQINAPIETGIIIHGGNPGEEVFNARRIFKPYNVTMEAKLSNRGFSHKTYSQGGKLIKKK